VCVCVSVGRVVYVSWMVVLLGGEGVETRPVDFPDGQIPVQLTTPACHLVYVYKMYSYFRTTLESFEPLISRVGQTIRHPLRIQINYAPNIKRDAFMPPSHFKCSYYILLLLVWHFDIFYKTKI